MQEQSLSPEKEHIAMFLIHSMQIEAWAETIQLNSQVYKHEFKAKGGALINTSRLFNRYMEQYLKDDIFELSAVISDSIESLIKLTPEKRSELTDIIEEFIEKNEKP